ncbi:MAG TPA: efflux RND transporter permease subunit [Caulobacteraceae bacterium]|jgi:HAE1 family hydrophobic/amphiphilic exporter-1|nr:efflux RND transporter permease subunit [Caulobacteraceae bacterium]
MNLSQISSWSIRNPIPIVLMFVVLTVGGLIGYANLRLNQFPDIDYPFVVVTVAQPGAAPTEMETQVTRWVEDSLAGIGQVKHINSTVVEGASTTFIEFQVGVDLEKVTNDVRNSVSTVRANLPPDIRDPVVQRVETSGQPIVYYVVRAPKLDPEQLSWFVDNDVAKTILGVKGVAEVDRQGGVSREIEVKLDPTKLASLGVTAATVSNQLKVNNINLPGGRTEVGGAEQAVRTLGSATSLDDFRAMRINLPNGRTLRLDDLGTIDDQWAEQRGVARYDGQEVVGFSVTRSMGSSEKDVTTQVRAAIDGLRKLHKDMSFEEVTSTTDSLMRSYDASVEALLLGSLLAVIVVFVFLRDWRATLVTAVAIPLSLIPTFGVMAMFNQSLNAISLLALSLTIGILVDDAIVEIENIVRHMRDGKPAYPAAMEAADEIGLAVVATTSTLLAVFAPTGVMPGIVGQFFKSFAIAACVSVFFSLVVARTLTPLMAAYLLRSNSAKEHDKPFWMDGYLGALKWSIKSFWTGLTIFLMGTAFFVFSVGMLLFIPQDFIPAQDQAQSSLSVQLAPGAQLADTDAVVQRLTTILRKQPEVEHVYASIGSATSFGLSGGGGNGEVRSATLTIKLTPRNKRAESQQDFEHKMGPLMRTAPGARVQFGNAGNGGGSSLYGVTLASDDHDALQSAIGELEREMRGVPGLSNVVSSASLVRPEIQITPKPEQAALLGVSANDISQVARVATLGDVDQLLPKYNLPDRQIPIRVVLSDQARSDLSVIENLQVPTRTGATVPLSSVADVAFGAGPDQITRQDRRESASIQSELSGITLQQASIKVSQLPIMKHLPPGVYNAANQQTEGLGELVTGFAFALGTGILLMYVVLVLLFRSFTDPLAIQGALPLCFGGAAIALLITGQSLSMPAFIGIIMLMGIAAKNSILLVDYAVMSMNAGMKRADALIDAARKRARPIIMTTVAMAAGMLPIALGLGTGSEFRRPMAIAVIGGLFTSTLLSLLFIPVMFIVTDTVGDWLGRVFKIRAQGKEETPPHGGGHGHGEPAGPSPAE